MLYPVLAYIALGILSLLAAAAIATLVTGSRD